ncbi:hypothetical protein DUNSADRAFT_8147 [Dunaliella salina]|uniref:Protein kinase domain-containing protein n=1 Tax=Dunaliella salina TaxID=3046 RepID=A0ABQ7GJX7_DUNSA|nr:hypothetical protein DUNSADRAFT_8147 [Dunaliella salina]|eukprot:KAF5834921.1 hypothetical protein DUNSADRAFT_8147 [Dunaliella salina]
MAMSSAAPSHLHQAPVVAPSQLRMLQLERRIRGQDSLNLEDAVVGEGTAAVTTADVPPLQAAALQQQQHSSPSSAHQQQQSGPAQQQQQQQLQQRGSARRKRSTPEQRQPSTGPSAQTGERSTAAHSLQPGSSLPRQPLQSASDKGRNEQGLQGRSCTAGVQGQLDAPHTLDNTSRGAKRARNSSPIQQLPQGFSQGVIVLDDISKDVPLPGSGQGQPSHPQHQQQPPQHQQQQQSGMPTPTRCLFGAQPPPPDKQSTKATSRSAQKQGGGGGQGSRSSGANQQVPRGQQTKLNSYYPVLDSSSRDSDLSGGPVPHNQHLASHTAAVQPQQPSTLTHATASNAPPTSNSTNPIPQPHLATTAGSHHQAGGRCAPLPGAAAAAGTGAAGPGGTGHAHGSHHGPSHLGRAPSFPCGHGLADKGEGVTEAVPKGVCDVGRAMAENHAQVVASLQAQLEGKDRQIAAMQEQHTQTEASLSSRLAASAAEVANLTSRLAEASAEVEAKARGHAEREAKLRSELVRCLQSGQRAERELTRLQLAAQGLRLGSVAIERSGINFQEVWRDGEAFVALQFKQQSLASQREAVEAARKALRKKLPLPPARAFGGPGPNSSSSSSSTAVASSSASRSGPSPGAAAEDGAMEGGEFVALDDVYKSRLAVLKREEDVLKDEMDRLGAEKRRHVRALKRMWDENGSKFGNANVVLGGRFVLLGLLGKGGFSEVFKAYDLLSMRVVAAKVHQLSPAWNEAKKASYVKHAIREVNIQKQMRHAHVVGLVDVLEISNESFATVLEYCEGGDLDSLLRDHGALPEKEARSLLQQMFAGLVYLNQPGRRVIHYDLKPANILFDTLGTAKITDFGLSKVVADGETMQGLQHFL